MSDTISLALDLDGAGSSGYDAAHDRERLARQRSRVWNVMVDVRWRTLAEIQGLTGDPQASISARLRDFRKKRFGSHTVNRRARGPRRNGLFEYQLVVSVANDEGDGVYGLAA